MNTSSPCTPVFKPEGEIVVHKTAIKKKRKTKVKELQEANRKRKENKRPCDTKRRLFSTPGKDENAVSSNTGASAICAEEESTTEYSMESTERKCDSKQDDVAHQQKGEASSTGKEEGEPLPSSASRKRQAASSTKRQACMKVSKKDGVWLISLVPGTARGSWADTLNGKSPLVKEGGLCKVFSEESNDICMGPIEPEAMNILRFRKEVLQRDPHAVPFELHDDWLSYKGPCIGNLALYTKGEPLAHLLSVNVTDLQQSSERASSFLYHTLLKFVLGVEKLPLSAKRIPHADDDIVELIDYNLFGNLKPGKNAKETANKDTSICFLANVKKTEARNFLHVLCLEHKDSLRKSANALRAKIVGLGSAGMEVPADEALKRLDTAKKELDEFSAATITRNWRL